MSAKIVQRVKKIIVLILARIFARMKIIGDDSKSVCDKIIYVMDIVSTKMTYTIVNSADK